MHIEDVLSEETAEFYNEIQRLAAEIKKKKEDFVKKREKEGWQKFKFSSLYYGSHPENGEGDIEINYLFHPGVDVSPWKNAQFSHGHSHKEESNNNFEEWIEKMGEEDYIEY